MSFCDNQEEHNHILSGADLDEIEPETSPCRQPCPSQELLRAVRSPTIDAVSTEELASREGSHREVWVGEGPCLEPSLCGSIVKENKAVYFCTISTLSFYLSVEGYGFAEFALIVTLSIQRYQYTRRAVLQANPAFL